MSNPTEIAWQVFRNEFQDGEKIVLEDDYGKFYYGYLSKAVEDGILVTRYDGKSRFFEWHQITFMAHDGFPVSEIMGMSYEEAAQRCEEIPTNIIREKLDNLTNKPKSQQQTYNPPKQHTTFVPDFSGMRGGPRRRATIGGGCPFVFEDIFVEDLLFKGNNGPQFWGEDNEETLILRSPNGACMHSFDMSHLFLFDGLKLP